MTDDPSGLINMAGINLCGTIIQSSGTTLQLQTSTATKILDIRATITNNDGACVHRRFFP